MKKKELEINHGNLHNKTIGKTFDLINGSTFTNGLITFEYGDMIKYSMDYLQAKKFHTLPPEDQKVLFVESILDFLRKVCMLDESEVMYYEQSIWFNVSLVENNNLQTCLEFTEQQATIASEILSIAKKSTSNDLRANLAKIGGKINLLPEQDKQVLNNGISLLLSANDVIRTEMGDKSFWGSFFCNAVCSGVGAVYGAAVGAVCPPAGVAVGIIVSSGLSAAVC